MGKNVKVEQAKYVYGIFESQRYPKLAIPDLKYEFFQTAITSFVQNLSRALKQFIPNVPVYILNTGDQLLTDEFIEAEGQEIPRAVIDVDGLSIASDQLTNPYERGEFIINENKQDIGYSAYLRRIPITFELPVKITVANIIEQLKWQEILLLLLYRNNTFHFQYYKKDNKGIYRLPDNMETERNVEYGFDSDRRYRTITIPIQLDLQYPAFDIFGTTSLMKLDNCIKNWGGSIFPDPTDGDSDGKIPTPGDNSVSYNPTGGDGETSETTDPTDPNNPNNPGGDTGADKPLDFTGPDNPGNSDGGNNNYSISEHPFGEQERPKTGDNLMNNDGTFKDYDEELIKEELIEADNSSRYAEVKNSSATNSWEPMNKKLSVHKKEEINGYRNTDKPSTGSVLH